MCIAIVTSPGKMVSDEVFERCWNTNRDGFGLAYVDARTGKVEIDKGWMAPSSALAKYKRVADHQQNADRYMLLHFRAATVGRVHRSSCHPFAVKGGAMIHNGTFWYDHNAIKSDSQALAEVMHNELHVANTTKLKDHFQKAFGYNRVAFLYDNNKIVIFSEEYDAGKGKYGQWKDGVWYSNGGYAGMYGGYYGDNAPASAAATSMYGDDDAYDAWLLNRGQNYRVG